jgi:SAM-dependent methyltransferase
MTDLIAASNGWNESAPAWLTEMGEHGDYGRQYVLDAPMLARVQGRGFRRALDVGCGEGRFCRLLRAQGIVTVGVDPTAALLARARELEPEGDYLQTTAEAMVLEAGSFDLVVSYLSLIDIEHLQPAIANMVAALRPGGTLLLANLTSFNTAGLPRSWITWADGQRRFCIDHYLEEKAHWSVWRGMRIRNWHRPLSTYMAAFLAHGLVLTHFAEPEPQGGDPVKAQQYRRVPYFHIMEWQKPAG